LKFICFLLGALHMILSSLQDFQEGLKGKLAQDYHQAEYDRQLDDKGIIQIDHQANSFTLRAARRLLR